MSAVKAAAPSRAAHDTGLEPEILTRIARGGLLICEDELRHQFRRDGEALRRLPWLLADLEQRGLIQSAVHYRLTPAGAGHVPQAHRPSPAGISSIPWSRPAPRAPQPAVRPRPARRAARRDGGRTATAP